MSIYDYGDKSIASNYAALSSPGEIPSVAEVPTSADGTGLEVSGWFATWHEDSSGEAFLPHAFDKAIASALAHGLPVLFNHAKGEVPIGFVKSCEVRPGGLWGTMILPSPPAGTKAAEIYGAVKAHLIPYFSVGGFWKRSSVGGKVKLMCDRLVELSLCSSPWNANARLAGVAAVQGVKSIEGEWVPADLNARVRRVVDEHERCARELEQLEYIVLRGRLGLRSRR